MKSMVRGYQIRGSNLGVSARARKYLPPHLIGQRGRFPRFLPCGVPPGRANVEQIRQDFNDLCSKIRPVRLETKRREDTIIPPEYFFLYLLPFLAFSRQNGSHVLFFIERDAQPYEETYRAFKSYPPLLGLELPDSFAYKLTALEKCSLAQQIIGLLQLFDEDKSSLDKLPEKNKWGRLLEIGIPAKDLRLTRREFIMKYSESGLDPRIRLFQNGYQAMRPFIGWFGKGERNPSYNEEELPPEIAKLISSPALLAGLSPEEITREFLMRLNRYLISLRHNMQFGGRKPIGIILEDTAVKRNIFARRPLFVDVSIGSGGCLLAVDLIASVFMHEEYENKSFPWATGIIATLPDKIAPKLATGPFFDVYASVRPVEKMPGEFQVRVPEYNPELFDCLYFLTPEQGLQRSSYLQQAQRMEKVGDSLAKHKTSKRCFEQLIETIRINEHVQSLLKKAGYDDSLERRVPFGLILRAVLRSDEISKMAFLDAIRFESEDFWEVYRIIESIINSLRGLFGEKISLSGLVQTDRHLRHYEQAGLLRKWHRSHQKMLRRIEQGCRERGIHPEVIFFCLKHLT